MTRAATKPVRLVLFHTGALVCALPVGRVQEIHRDVAMTRVRRAPEHVRGVLNLRGQLLTVIDLGVRLGMGAATGESGPQARVVVARHAETPVGLLVDGVLDSPEVTPDQLHPVPANAGPRRVFFAGVYRSDQGLAGVLDLDELLDGASPPTVPPWDEPLAARDR